MPVQSLRLEPKGLFTNPSALLATRGALSAATNVVIDRPGVIQSRRGNTRVTQQLGNYIDRLFEYEQQLLAHFGTTGLSRYNGAGWTNYAGSFTTVNTEFKTQYVIAKRNLYFTTGTSLQRLSVYTGVPERAGQYKVPGFARANCVVVDTAATLGPNWLVTGYDVAYRARLFKKDGYLDPIVGSPSGRFIFSNGSGATRSVTVRMTLPKEIQNSSAAAANYYDGYFIQLYRSAQVLAGVTPSDELQQVYEKAISSADVTNGYTEITDVCPDDFRQGFLETNPSTGKSIAAANELPPQGACIALWKERLWVANVAGPQRFTLQIVAVLGVGGIQNTDTVILDGVTYTGTTGAVGANQYFLESAGSAAQNIERTAMNLVEAINKSASNTTNYAQYAAKPDDPLTIGRIVIEHRLPAQTAFTPYVGAGSKTECWQPVLPATTPDADLTSTNMSLYNGICWSKPNQPDAFPLPNLMRAGPRDKQILKIVALRDRLWVFKEDGVYVVTGHDESNFSVSLWDPTIIAINPDVIQVLSNEIYLLSTQGLLSVSEAGPSLKSGPIQKTLLDLISPDTATPGLNGMIANAYAVAYESDHKFILAAPAGPSGSEAVPNTFYVYNTETNTWTSWTSPTRRMCGFVRPSEDRLYWGESNGGGVDAYVHKERKARTTADYLEYDSSGISKTVTFHVEHGGNPAAMKQFMEAVFLFVVEPTSAVSVTFTSERGSGSAISVTSKSNLARRTFPSPLVSRAARLAVSVTHAVASEGFELSGLALKFREYQGRVGR